MWQYIALKSYVRSKRQIHNICWQSLKIEKENVNVEGQRPQSDKIKSKGLFSNSADKLKQSRKVKNLKKKEEEIEGDWYEEEEAVKEGSQIQQRVL